MTMQAIYAKTPGEADQLVFGDFPIPCCAHKELLVRVKATSLNRADILQRQGKYSPPKGTTPILGLEMSGIVEEVGTNCFGWQKGDRVCALLSGGGYAQYVTIPANMAMAIPPNLTLEEGAVLPEVFLTAYQSLFWLGEIKAGFKVLLHAGASGVGSAAIQLIKEAGATPIVTVRTPEKLDFCYKLGAKVAIDTSDGQFAEEVLEKTANRGVNLIIDCIGAAYWEQNMRVLAIDGKLVLIGLMGGAKIEQFNLATILGKRLNILGTTLRNRKEKYKEKLTRDFVNNMLPAFAEERLKPVIDSVFSWKDVVDAHRYMEQNFNLGKIVLIVGE